jgi:hypothetical protein
VLAGGVLSATKWNVGHFYFIYRALVVRILLVGALAVRSE